MCWHRFLVIILKVFNFEVVDFWVVGFDVLIFALLVLDC